MLGDYQLQFTCNLVGVLMFMMIIVFHYIQANLTPSVAKQQQQQSRPMQSTRKPVPARRIKKA